MTEEELIEEYENSVKESTEEVTEDINMPEEEQALGEDNITNEDSDNLENSNEESSVEENEI